MKAKVLFVSPASKNLVGGIAKWTANILEYYHSLPDTEINLEPVYNESAIVSLSGDGILKRIKKGLRNYLPLIKEIRRKFRKDKFDVVHISTSASIGLLRDLLITAIAHKHKAKVVVHFHFGRIPDLLKSSGWERKLLKRILEKVETVVVMDYASLTALKEMGYTNVCYIPNPLSIETQRFVEANANIVREQGKILFVGQMLKTKGIFELVEATKEIPDIQVVFIGQLPDNETSDSFKRQASDEKYKLRGVMPFENVIKEMLSSSIFVLPTYTEGFPNVIIESMACGCPIITCGVGAITEMLDVSSDMPCGICIQPQDVAALKSAILSFMENPQKANEMGRRAKARVYAEYSIEKVWRELEDLWKN